MLASVSGAFLCALAIGIDVTSPLRWVAKLAGLSIGALAFVAGFLLAAVTEGLHATTRCPECGRRIWRSEIGGSATYYPCRRCEITWTCECHNESG